MKTQSAQAAALIRKELKVNFPGVKFSVRSENYSMGSNVSIAWIDGPTSKAVEEFTNKYQYGHFNGMEDIYEYSNSRDDIPQAKFVHTSRKMSDGVREQIKKDWGIEDENEWTNSNCWGTDLIWREFVKLDLYSKGEEKEKTQEQPKEETNDLVEYLEVWNN